jgi:hypothetical protein
MKHVLFADKSLLVGDAAAETLVEYAALVGQIGSADAVELHAIDADGDAVDVTFLLNSGTALVIQSTHSQLSEPDNAASIAYMRGRIDAYTAVPIDFGSADQDEFSR